MTSFCVSCSVVFFSGTSWNGRSSRVPGGHVVNVSVCCVIDVFLFSVVFLCCVVACHGMKGCRRVVLWCDVSQGCGVSWM